MPEDNNKGLQLQLRDWITIAGLIGSLMLFNWRMGVVEKKIDNLDNLYVRKESVELLVKMGEAEHAQIRNEIKRK